MLSFYDKIRLKGGDYMINSADRYFIERKYHDPEKEFNAFTRMAYHGTGYIEESGIDDEALLKGLEKLSEDMKKQSGKRSIRRRTKIYLTRLQEQKPLNMFLKINDCI